MPRISTQRRCFESQILTHFFQRLVGTNKELAGLSCRSMGRLVLLYHPSSDGDRTFLC